MSNEMLIGKTSAAHEEVFLLGRMANRHGLIAGATGTGKTVTLQGLAEGFSDLGVPVFLADVKGDLSGIASPGEEHPKIAARVEALGLNDFTFGSYPVTFWDLFRKLGHPVRTTISDMGPLLLGRLMGLNETQQGVLTLAFRAADDNGLLLLDLKDLRAILQFLSENAAEFRNLYGNISAASVGAIQRALLGLEQQGGTNLFGEPALNLDDLMQTDEDGRGVINILAADELITAPKLYGTFLLWLLSELYENLDEVGDRDRPRLALFFDEAHLMFDGAPTALVDKVEQVVRLIRSKGVGVYFVTQNPADIPGAILGQLGNRVQHGLRAYTPSERKRVKAAAEAFRVNPAFDTEEVTGELAVGEALVSTLDEEGRPNVVQRTLVRPPRSRVGPLGDEERREQMRNSLVADVYDVEVDRESAYEILKRRAEQAARQAEATKQAEVTKQAKATKQDRERRSMERSNSSRSDSPMDAFIKSAARAVGSQVGREIIRGVLGSLFGGSSSSRRR